MKIFLYTIIVLIFSSILIKMMVEKLGINKKEVTYKKYFIISATIILTFIYGFRNYNVGIDTSAYYLRFEYASSLNILTVLQGVSKEWGFAVFEHIISKYFGSFSVLLFLVGGLYTISVGKLINRFSPFPLIAYLLFISLGFFSFGMTAIRQTIAISIVLLSVNAIADKKLIKFIVLVLIASSFHVTALIFLPAYLVNILKINKKTIIGIIITLLFVIGFREQVRNVGLSLFDREIEEQDIGGYLFYLFLIVSIILGFIYRTVFIKLGENNKSIIFLLVIAMIIFPITQFHPAVSRLYFYYSIILVVYIPMMLSSIKDLSSRYLITIAYIAVLSYLLIYKIAPAAQLENFTFIW